MARRWTARLALTAQALPLSAVIVSSACPAISRALRLFELAAPAPARSCGGRHGADRRRVRQRFRLRRGAHRHAAGAHGGASSEQRSVAPASHRPDHRFFWRRTGSRVCSSPRRTWRPAASRPTARACPTCSSARRLRAPNPAGRQACRPAGRAANQVRPGDQPQDARRASSTLRGSARRRSSFCGSTEARTVAPTRVCISREHA